MQKELIKKILAPIFIILVPLLLAFDVRSVLVFGQFGISKEGDPTLSMAANEISWLYIDILKVILFALLVGFAIKRFQPKVDLGWSVLRIFKALSISLLLFFIVGIPSYFTFGLHEPSMHFSPFVPGAAFLPEIGLLCIGVIEGFKTYLPDRRILIPVLAIYALALMMEHIHITPFSYWILHSPLIQIDSQLRDWRYYLPSVAILMSCFTYWRLGLVPALIFLLSSVAEWSIALRFGFWPNTYSASYWISVIAVFVIVDRFFPSSPQKFKA